MIDINYSILKWNTDISNAPSNEPLLIMYEDNTGDSLSYYTVLGYYLKDVDYWISDNSLITGKILCWLQLSKIEL